MRPIRCKKIRYYADRRFRVRLLPPPGRATPFPRKRTPVAPPRADGSATAPAAEGGEAVTPETRMPAATTLQHANLEDIEKLESITIKEFGERLGSLTFEHAGERPTESELDADVNIFLEALR